MALCTCVCVCVCSQTKEELLQNPGGGVRKMLARPLEWKGAQGCWDTVLESNSGETGDQAQLGHVRPCRPQGGDCQDSPGRVHRDGATLERGHCTVQGQTVGVILPGLACFLVSLYGDHRERISLRKIKYLLPFKNTTQKSKIMKTCNSFIIEDIL